MRFLSVFVFLILAAFALNAGIPTTAQAGDYKRLHIPDDPRGEGHLPYCDDTKVLRTILKRFRKADHRTWKRGLLIDEISHTHERAHRPRDGYGTIGRRYCRARAHLSNGRHPRIHYLIEEHQGFASISWNVEFCIVGLDRWRIYDAWCRTVRP